MTADDAFEKVLNALIDMTEQANDRRREVQERDQRIREMINQENLYQREIIHLKDKLQAVRAGATGATKADNADDLPF